MRWQKIGISGPHSGALWFIPPWTPQKLHTCLWGHKKHLRHPPNSPEALNEQPTPARQAAEIPTTWLALAQTESPSPQDFPQNTVP